MESAKFDHTVLENWWVLLKDLNVDVRIELATRLISSLKSGNEPETNSDSEDWLKLFGAWANDSKSAEEMIADIKASRLTNRKIESLD